MSIQVKVYDNSDHTCLVWLPDGGKIPQCRGFTVRRLLNGQEGYLHGFVGFSDGDKFDPAAPWKFPLQRYMWWDYGVKPDDKVQYSVIPVVGPDHNHLALAADQASPLTPPMTISGHATRRVSAYFNKGIVSAQWVSRALAQLGKKPDLGKLIGTRGNPLRNELSGLLRTQILSLLADTKKNNGEIYAALYELNDPELIDGLTALGKKCHLLLANGAFKSGKPDENKAVRDSLRGKVDLYDRIVTGSHFAHNKFVVFCDSKGAPQSVLSGSTNWTMTGLCTQVNNGIIVDDPGLAEFYVKEWQLLKAAKNAYPPTLAQANSTPGSFTIDGGRITQWFVPTTAAQDLDFARKLISAAERGILFLFFNPGQFVDSSQPKRWTLLQNILNRHQQGATDYNPGLYIRGIVNQEIPNLTTESADAPKRHAILDPTKPANPVTLFSGGDNPPQRLRYDAMVPKNIKDTFHDWLDEVMNQGVHVHSKVIVLDPFGANPVVMTGSHNLGFKASSQNDDNLMIVEGNGPLAAAYAANIIAIYQAYRWNAYVEAHRQDPQVWHGPVDKDDWQDGYLDPTKDELAEIKFWLGTGATAGTPATPAAAPAAPAAPAAAAAAPSAPAAGPSPAAAPAPAAAKKRAAAKKKAAAPKTATAKKKAAAKKPPAAKKARAKKKAR